MIDIDKWGPPPPVTDNVNHGDLLKSLNTLGFKIQQENALYTTVPALTLAEVKAKVAAFGPYAKNLIEAHTSKRGVTHRETKKTVALEKKDNFRMATMEECVSLANVNAFVSPAGGKAALSGLSFDLTERFQQNDIYPIAAISNQPLFKHTAAYSTHLSAVLRGPGMIGRFKDNLIMSPRQSGNSNNIFSLYKGFKSDAGVNNRYYDTGGVKYGLKGNPENPTIYEEIGASAAGRVLVFESSNKAHTGPVKVSVTDVTIGTAVVNGLVGSYGVKGLNKYRGVFVETADVSYAGPKTHAYLWQHFYGVRADGESAASLPNTTKDYLDQGSGLFSGSTTGGNRKGIALSVLCKSNNPNVTLAFENYFASTCWEVMDRSYIVKVQGVISHTNTTTGKKLYFNFSFAIRATIIQTIASSSVRVEYTPVYHYPPTVLVESDLNSFNSGYTRMFEKGSVLDTFAHPGSIIEGGLYVRQQTYPQHSYVHYTRFVDITTPLDYFKTPINALDGYWVNTIPVSHIGMAPWGNTAQRIIPVEYGAGGFKVLSYAMDNSNSGWTWSELSWTEPDQPKPRTSFKAPDKGARLNTSKPIPPSVSSFVTKDGVSYHGLNFVECNRYTGSVGLTYANGSFSETGKVTLNSVYLTNLMKQETVFLARAKVYYGNTGVEKHQEFTVGVFTLGKNGLTTKDQALVVMTDGFGYMELAISNYTITNGVYNVTTAVDSLTRYVITPSPKPTLFTGEVNKVDTYRILSTFSDMSVYEYDTGETMLSFNRPWGDHRIGKATVCLENYNPTTLTMSVSSINVQPTKLVGASTSLGVPLTDTDWNTPNQTSYIAYPVVNSMPLETFDVCTPTLRFTCNKGLRISHSRLGRHTTINPTKTDGVAYDFDSIQQGDLVVPSGYPVVLSGRAMKTYRDMGFNSNNNGVGWHHYLKRDGLNLELESTIFKELEPRSDYIEIGGYSDITGNVTLFDNELTISGLKMSYARKGSSFPISIFSDPAGTELYDFFYYTDAPHYPPRYEIDLPTTKTVYATQVGTYTVDIYSKVPPVNVEWFTRNPSGVVTRIAGAVATAIGNNVYRASVNHVFSHWDLSGSIVYAEASDVRPEMTKSTECNVTVTIPILEFTSNIPASVNLVYNGIYAFSVAVNAQAGVRSYEWYQRRADGTVVLESSTANNYIPRQTTRDDKSTRWCVVTDNVGQKITSTICTTNVAAPIFRYTTNLPATITVDYAGTATYTVNVESQAGVVEYRWFQKVGENIETFAVIPSNSTTSTAARNNQRTNKNGSTVWCETTDAEGNKITSVVCTQTVRAPELRFNPDNVATKTVNYNTTASFDVGVVSAAGVASYKWYQKIGGVTTEVGSLPTLNLPNQKAPQNGSTVWCVVTDNEGNQITSVICTLTVNAAALRFTKNLSSSLVISYGATANFDVTVVADAGVKTYQWYHRKAGVDNPVGSNSPSLSLPNQTLQAGEGPTEVWVVVTDNDNSTITSITTRLTINAPTLNFALNNVAVREVGYNENAPFEVVVNAQAGVKWYRWYQRVGSVTTQVGSAASLVIPNQRMPQNGSTVWCEIEDNAGYGMNSVVCTLTVKAPFITTDLVTPIYHYATPTPKRFTVALQPWSGVTQYAWKRIPYGESTGVPVTTGITSNNTTSHLDFVMNSVSAMIERVFCEISFAGDAAFGLQSTTSVIYVSSPLEFSLNLTPTRPDVLPNASQTFTVATIGGHGEVDYVWYKEYTAPGGTKTTTNESGAPSITFNLAGEFGGSWKVWCVATARRLLDSVTSVQSVTVIASPIELTYGLQDWMWGSNMDPTSIFISVLDKNGPYTFDWIVDGALWKSESSSYSSSQVTFGKEGIIDDHVLSVKVTDVSGNHKTFTTSVTTTAFGGNAQFDPMPPKVVPIHQDVNGVSVFTGVTGSGLTYPLRFQYFNLISGTNTVHSQTAQNQDMFVHHFNYPGAMERFVCEVGATDQGILPSNEYILLSVPSRIAGHGLSAPVASAGNTTYAVTIPGNIGRARFATFMYYIDTSVAPQFRKAIEFKLVQGMAVGATITGVLPPELAGKTVEVYAAAIDADGKWFVSGVVTATVAGGAPSWSGTQFTGRTVNSPAEWNFTYKTDGTWTWDGNGLSSFDRTGDWRQEAGASASGYSIKAVLSSGMPHDGSNITGSWQKLNINRYVTLKALMPPVGEPNNWQYHVTTVDIRNDDTGVIKTGLLNIEVYCERR